MLRHVAVALISSVLIVSCATVPGSPEDEGKFNHSSYLPANLADVIARMEIDPRVNYWLDASHPKYEAVVTYAGEIRQIDPNVKKLITMWAKAMQHPDSVPDIFNYEVHVTQAGQSYWMPIQDVLLEPWREEMRGNARAKVYLLLMGAYERAPIFTIASFSAKV
jgi:hypothetical protein